MIYFIYGEDSYRAKRKIEEIIEGYKKIHKSGLNLIYIDATLHDYKDFYSNLQINPMFAEKKLLIIKNIFKNDKFQENIAENLKELNEIKDIIVIYDENGVDQRTKIFKALKKNAKCQEFKNLSPIMAKKWASEEFNRLGSKINNEALDLLASYTGSDLWKMSNEINKLSNYKQGSVIKKEDVKLLVKPNIDNDIFKTIEAIALKNKKQALSLLYKHMDGGDDPLYLLSMIAYQFKTLLIIKEFQDKGLPYASIAKKSGLHSFVVQKNNYLCNQFSLDKLKQVYQKIFQTDLDIKTGKVDSDTALDLLLSQI